MEELMEYNKSNRIDKGVQLFYWKLSCRRKFIRTLWTIPAAILAVSLMNILQGHYVSLDYAVILTMVLTILFAAQLVYTYVRWKRGD